MLKDIVWPEDRTFSSESSPEPIEFYLNALSNSNRFDLQLGYFSSAAIKVLAYGFASFLFNGGKMRIIANNILSADDAEIIKNSSLENFTSDAIDLTDFHSIKSNLDEHSNHFLKCISWLIAKERIEIILVKPKGKKGISHNKTGVFYDGESKVAFRASCNFTFFGLLENHEDLDVYLEETEVERKRILSQEKRFEEIISGNASYVEYVDQSGIEIVIKEALGDYDVEIGELLIEETQLLEKLKQVHELPNVINLISEIKKDIEDKIFKPRFPYSDGPRPYQVEAYQNWKKNNNQGLFAMATGTGKTITSLNCVLEEFKINGYYKTIILVPTISLADQWYSEVKGSFNFQNVLVCSSQNQNWNEGFKQIISDVKYGFNPDYIIILTYATYRTKKFQQLLNDNFKNEFEKIIFIADEAHTIGSPKLLEILPSKINSRIGLSATPERQFDEVGVDKMNHFFNSYPPKYTFEFNMKEAIDIGVLSEYYYYPKIVRLEPDELHKYSIITNELAKYYDHKTNRYKDLPYVKNKLIERKSIIHKATNKLQCLSNIVNEIGKENFKLAFIYVPEGFENEYDEFDEDYSDPNDDAIIDDYKEMLDLNFGIRVRKFTGETKDRGLVLKQFSNHKLDALLAMKCLDEGVDIPETQIAIFCSSTGNPRQYIQRRGRVLRKYKNKVAIIYDMIVKPRLDPTEINQNLIKLEKNIFESEIRRVVNFALLAKNYYDCIIDLEPICSDLGIDIHVLIEQEKEKYNVKL
jgi:superfamily II DNA or RNA helicase